jgi:hypothetical protein
MEEALDLGFTQAQVDAVNGTYVDAEFALAFIKRDNTRIHNPFFQMDVLNFTIEKGDEVASALEPGRVQGFVKDAEGKAVSGAEVRKGVRVWGTTSGDGSFDFAIAPGDHGFDVYDGDRREASFTATVTAGQTEDAGTVKFKAEDDGNDYSWYYIIILVVIIVVILAVVMMARRKVED